MPSSKDKSKDYFKLDNTAIYANSFIELIKDPQSPYNYKIARRNLWRIAGSKTIRDLIRSYISTYNYAATELFKLASDVIDAFYDIYKILKAVKDTDNPITKSVRESLSELVSKPLEDLSIKELSISMTLAIISLNNNMNALSKDNVYNYPTIDYSLLEDTNIDKVVDAIRKAIDRLNHNKDIGLIRPLSYATVELLKAANTDYKDVNVESLLTLLLFELKKYIRYSDNP
ncbi:MAG: hypothetical protein ARM1_0685 [Candidatus Micrarchaeota archaeon]|nr:MAG: hypothetical protein ARM1_0685 [Candidatus Micrarchaeota archaeon]